MKFLGKNYAYFIGILTCSCTPARVSATGGRENSEVAIMASFSAILSKLALMLSNCIANPILASQHHGRTVEKSAKGWNIPAFYFQSLRKE